MEASSFWDSKRPWQLLSLVLALGMACDKGRGLLKTSAPGVEEKLPPRTLAETEGDDSGHPQDALFFLFSAVIFGTVVLHLTTLPRLQGLQQTVVLFVLGMVYSLVHEGFSLHENTGMMGRSYTMWMDIDPHLLLFAMLPVLLTGDAMTIDTSIARSVSKQCLYLAGPGVVAGSFLMALFLWVWLPYDWPFLLCLVTGSILAATDPVAVVGLLKELGASPTLTVQIQGESLLNDGTAIVLYTVAYSMLQGVKYDAGDVIIFLVKTALCAVGLGWIIGWFFVTWIRTTANRLEHHAGMIQSSLTLCCAYWSFILSEGVFGISGVLCTVAASLVLADKMWPSIVDKDSLHHVWHMFEYLGNTIIFFLAGALTGGSMTRIPFADYLHLLVIYVVATLVRGFLLFVSKPILTYLGEDHAPVTFADAVIMTWGGLRGAVGLVLAMQVSVHRADDRIERMDANRVLFYVGGVATLTLVVNATTCPALVKALGITSTPAAKQRLLLQLYEQLQRLAKNKSHPVEVRNTLQTVLHDAKHQIEALVEADNAAKVACCTGLFSRLSAKFKLPAPRSATHMIRKLEIAKRDFEGEVDDHMLAVLDIPFVPWTEEMQEALKERVRQGQPDASMIQAMHEAHLALVRSHYWQQIDAGEFVAGTSDAEMLLSSVSHAFKFASRSLADFGFLTYYLRVMHDEEAINEEVIGFEDEEGLESAPTGILCGQLSPKQSVRQSVFQSMQQNRGTARSLPVVSTLRRRVAKLSQSPLTRWQTFVEESLIVNVSMAVVIAVNAVFIAVEQTERNGNQNHASWFVIEVIFTIIFASEFLIKVAIFRLAYFLSGWNLFDFILVVLGVAGMVIEGVAIDSSKASDVTGEARLLRVNRVFRVLRIVRIFRLAKFLRILKAKLTQKDLCIELAEHIQTITVLRAFVRAHTSSQAALTKFFGYNGDLRSCEEARCIMASHTEVLNAITLAAAEAKDVESKLSGMALLRSNINATAELSTFVLAANKSGVISTREAECILHPLEQHLRSFYRRLEDSQQGFEDGGSHNAAATSKQAWGSVVSTFEQELPGSMGQEDSDEPPTSRTKAQG